MENINIFLIRENEDRPSCYTFQKDQFPIIDNQIYQKVIIESLNLDFNRHLIFYYSWNPPEGTMVWKLLQEIKPIFLEIYENKIYIKYVEKKLKSIEDDQLLEFFVERKEKDEDIKKKGPRAKERKICEVLKSVFIWRKYYKGFKYQGNFYKLNLQKTAKKLNISKKSLDDYLPLIRLGKKCNFNFQKHSEEKIGFLRDFVKREENHHH